MLTTVAPPRGFTLIELMIALAIAALLVVLAMPSYSTWIADNQIRNAAESIAGGLRYAQGEAIKQNSQVEFVINPATGTGGWTVDLVAAPIPPLQTDTFAEGADRVSFATFDTGGAGGATKITFTGLGYRATDATGAPINPDASPVLAEVRITSPVAGSRSLNVLVFGGASGVAGQASRTGIKICDPKWPATDPKGCPA